MRSLNIYLLPFSLLFFLCFLSGAQQHTSEIIFELSSDWLTSQLNRTQFDEKQGLWQNFRFYINEQKKASLKKISSKNRITSNIKEKSYQVRSFFLKDINPQKVEVKNIAKPTDKLPQYVIALTTFSYEKNIQRSINGRKVSSTASTYIQVPNYKSDSLLNYANMFAEKFKAVIQATTTLTASNSRMIFDVLKGDFITELDVLWTAKHRFSNVIQLTSKQKEMFIIHQPDDNIFVLLQISEKGIVKKNL